MRRKLPTIIKPTPADVSPELKAHEQLGKRPARKQAASRTPAKDKKPEKPAAQPTPAARRTSTKPEVKEPTSGTEARRAVAVAATRDTWARIETLANVSKARPEDVFQFLAKKAIQKLNTMLKEGRVDESLFPENWYQRRQYAIRQQRYIKVDDRIEKLLRQAARDPLEVHSTNQILAALLRGLIEQELESFEQEQNS